MRRLALLVVAAALTGGCAHPVVPSMRSATTVAIAARAEIGGLLIETLNEDWTELRLNVYDVGADKPFATLEFQAAIDIDPDTHVGTVRLVALERIQRGEVVLYEAPGTFDRPAVAALAAAVDAFSTANAFPSGHNIASAVQALAGGRRVAARKGMGRQPGVTLKTSAGATPR
ncbi:MAG: hypothetical protein JWM80_344 [Cyanobacteria bacterium RYN_339]|nr:hypothetical protein [Cyanobacteria bacterium RYN_339]